MLALGTSTPSGGVAWRIRYFGGRTKCVVANPPGLVPWASPALTLLLFPRRDLARGAHAGSAQCMAMLEPWPTVSFLSHPPARKRFPLIRPGKLSGMQASHYFASIFFDDFYLGHSVRAPGHQARGISCITWLDHTGPLGHVPFRPGSSSPPGVRQLGWRSYLCLGAITAWRPEPGAPRPISERKGSSAGGPAECRWLEPSHGSAQVCGRVRYTYTISVCVYGNV